MSNIQRIHRQRRREEAILAVQGILNDYLLTRESIHAMINIVANEE